MKYIFIILICFFSLAGYSQNIQPRAGALSTVQDDNLFAKTSFKIPVFQSLALANSATSLDSTGKLIFVRDSNAVFYRTNQHTWAKLAASGDIGDAWLTTGNTPYEGSYLGTSDGGIDLVFRASGLKMQEMKGVERIWRAGVLDTTVGGNTYFEIDDTDADSANLYTGLYKFNKLGFEIGGNNLYFPQALGAVNSVLTITNRNGNNAYLSWLPSQDSSFTTATSISVDTTSNSFCVNVGVVQTCYPVAGVISIVTDSVCVTLNGTTTCYAAVGSVITNPGGLDSVTIGSGAGCWYNHAIAPTPTCIELNSVGQYIVDGALDSDSSNYIFYYPGNVQAFSLPTLLKNLFAGSGIYISDTTISGDEYTAIYNTINAGNYLVSVDSVGTVDSTVTIYAPIVYYWNGVLTTITEDAVFIVNTVPTGYSRTDAIYIDSDGNMQIITGTADTILTSPPVIPPGGILVSYVYVDEGVVTVGSPNVGINKWTQGGDSTLNPIIGSKNNLPLTFITNNVARGYFDLSGNFTANNTLISNNDGGVGLSLLGGSAIRWRGTGISYIDGNEIWMRTGASYENRLILKPSGNLLIGTNSTADIPSAIIVGVDSTKGFLVNRVTGALMAAIVSPANGLLVYNVDSLAFCYYNGSAWVKLAAGGGSSATTTLQQAWNNDSTSSPTIDIRENELVISAASGTKSTVLDMYADGGVSILAGDNSASITNSIQVTPTAVQVASTSNSNPTTSSRVAADTGKIMMYSVRNGDTTITRVGVGTANPQAPLHVVGDGTTTAAFMNGNVGIGVTSPDASSLLELESTTKGVLIPRMTEVQRNAISSPATGLQIFQTDGNVGLYYYDGSTWTSVGTAAIFGVTDNFYFKSVDGQAADGTIFDNDAADTTNLNAATIHIEHDIKIGDDNTGTFVFGQDCHSEVDNSYVFGRNDTIFGSGNTSEASAIFGWSGKMTSSPSSILMALKGGVDVEMDAKANTLLVAADSAILRAGVSIVGGLKYNDGSEGASKVLTSDATGNAAWATPSIAVGGITGLGTGVATWLATPSSANLASAVTNETGSLLLVFNTSPNLITPTFGTSVTGIAPLLRNADNIANFAQLGVYPSSGTNVASAFQIIPRGTGYSATIKSQFSFCNTDVVADPTNTEVLLLRAVGANGYTFNSTSAGTGTVRPIDFEFNGTAALTLKTDGTIGAGVTSPTSTLHTTSFATAYVAKSGSYTATIADNVIEVTATGQTITLPTAVGVKGRHYTIKLTASGSCTVATTSSQTIDGSTTYSLSAQYKYVTLQSNNVNWNIIANN